MKTTARFILSATTGIGLAVFTFLSAFISGVNAPATFIAFSLLAIYGMIEIAILSYGSPRFEVRPAAVRSAPTLVPMPTRSRRRTAVNVPVGCDDRRAA